MKTSRKPNSSEGRPTDAGDFRGERAQPWLSTYNVVAVRKAIEDQEQAVLSGKKQAEEAVRDAQKNADEILRPYREKIAHPFADDGTGGS